MPLTHRQRKLIERLDRRDEFANTLTNLVETVDSIRNYHNVHHHYLVQVIRAARENHTELHPEDR